MKVMMMLEINAIRLQIWGLVQGSVSVFSELGLYRCAWCGGATGGILD